MKTKLSKHIPSNYRRVAWKGAKRVLSPALRQDLALQGLIDDAKQEIEIAALESQILKEDVRTTSNRGQRAAYAFLRGHGFRRGRGETHYTQFVLNRKIYNSDLKEDPRPRLARLYSITELRDKIVEVYGEDEYVRILDQAQKDKLSDELIEKIRRIL